MTDDTTTTAAAVEVASIDESNREQNTALALIESMNRPGTGIYSSIVGDNFADKLRVAAALTTSEPVVDHLNETIELKDFVAQAITITDPMTGVTNDAARVILIDADGTAYHAVSLGLAQSLSNIVNVVGAPATWEAPIKVTVAQERTRRGFNVFTLKFV